jgi:hypothetical protein
MSGKRHKMGSTAVASHSLPGSCTFEVAALLRARGRSTLADLRKALGFARYEISAVLAKMEKGGAVVAYRPPLGTGPKSYEWIAPTSKPVDTRVSQTYQLLRECAPKQVLVDVTLRPGEWYVVRAPSGWEQERLNGVAA